MDVLSDVLARGAPIRRDLLRQHLSRALGGRNSAGLDDRRKVMPHSQTCFRISHTASRVPCWAEMPDGSAKPMQTRRR